MSSKVKKPAQPGEYTVKTINLPTLRVIAGDAQFDVNKEQAQQILRALMDALDIKIPSRTYAQGYREGVDDTVSKAYARTTGRLETKVMNVLRPIHSELIASYKAR